eukprot:SAG31_NODE_4069_length_3619_cov_17.893466_3_plen_78_part_00
MGERMGERVRPAAAAGCGARRPRADADIAVRDTTTIGVQASLTPRRPSTDQLQAGCRAAHAREEPQPAVGRRRMLLR